MAEVPPADLTDLASSSEPPASKQSDRKSQTLTALVDQVKGDVKRLDQKGPDTDINALVAPVAALDFKKSSISVVLCPTVDGTQTRESCNSNNHSEYSPFTTDAIDPQWWALLSETQRTEITSALPAFGSMEMRKIEVPHDANLSWNEAGRAIYRAFGHTYDYHRWCPSLFAHLPAGTQIHVLSKTDRIVLSKIAALRMLTDRCVSETSAFEDLSPELLAVLKSRFERKTASDAAPALFVRLSTTSGKNDRALRGVQDEIELLNFLCESKTVQQHLAAITRTDTASGTWADTCAIITQPWQTAIDSTCEFRVFVYKRRVTALSQQHWYQSVGLTADRIRHISERIHAWFESELRASMPMANAVLDVWIDRDSKPHLIELNPFGAWASSGASLFHWTRDFDKLHNEAAEVFAAFVVERPS